MRHHVQTEPRTASNHNKNMPARYNRTARKIKALFFLSLACAPTYSTDLNHVHPYFWFNYQLAAGNIAEAHSWFTQNLHEASPHVYKGYAHLLKTAGNYKAITSLIPKLDSHFANDPDMQLIFYTALASTGESDSAHERIMKLSSQFKANQEIAYAAAQAYLAHREPINALQVINDYLQAAPLKGNHFAFYFLKAQILLQLTRKEEALESVRRCTDLQPRFDAGHLMKALLEEQVGTVNNAIRSYITFLGLSGSDAAIEKHLLSLFLKQKIADYKEPNLMIAQDCLQRAVSLFGEKKYQAGLNEIDRCLQKQKLPVSSNKKTILKK